MSATDEPSRRAWDPLTPNGVATFARASFGRVLFAQFLVALLMAGTVAWFLQRAWFPVVRTAIQHLPEQGEIRNAQLDWRGDSSVKLAGNHFLGVTVDLTHSGRAGRESQLQVEFGRKYLRVYHMLDYEVFDYPAGWTIAFNRAELAPRWGAWEPALLTGAAAATVIGLMVLWALLATLYCAPVRMITFFENRDLNWRQSWRLAGAAMMPGALFLTVGIVGHGLGWLDLVQLGGVCVLHIIIGWIYLAISPLFLPAHPAAARTKRNPFAGEKKPETE